MVDRVCGLVELVGSLTLLSGGVSGRSVVLDERPRLEGRTLDATC